jgi:hypothetical protein
LCFDLHRFTGHLYGIVWDACSGQLSLGGTSIQPSCHLHLLAGAGSLPVGRRLMQPTGGHGYVHLILTSIVSNLLVSGTSLFWSTTTKLFLSEWLASIFN